MSGWNLHTGGSGSPISKAYVILLRSGEVWFQAHLWLRGGWLEFFHKDGFWRCSCNRISGTLHCLECTWISWSVVICPCTSCWNAKEEDIFKCHIVLHFCIEIITIGIYIQEVSDLGRGRIVAVLPEFLIF